jgi:tetratricopeptide (TPR) repeat protein
LELGVEAGIAKLAHRGVGHPGSTMPRLAASSPAKGLPDADRAIALNPRSAMALHVRAKIYEALGRSEQAAAGMRAALAIDPRIAEQIEAMEKIGKQ